MLKSEAEWDDKEPARASRLRVLVLLGEPPGKSDGGEGSTFINEGQKKC